MLIAVKLSYILGLYCRCIPNVCANDQVNSLVIGICRYIAKMSRLKQFRPNDLEVFRSVTGKQYTFDIDPIITLYPNT